jgi:4-alpha-glucanotransferase
MLAILPLQDWLAMDGTLRAPDPDTERINIPAHSRHYWRYRMHLSIEELLAAEELNENIRDVIHMTSRNKLH